MDDRLMELNSLGTRPRVFRDEDIQAQIDKALGTLHGDERLAVTTWYDFGTGRLQGSIVGRSKDGHWSVVVAASHDFGLMPEKKGLELAGAVRFSL